MTLRYSMFLTLILSLPVNAQDKEKPQDDPDIDMSMVKLVGTTAHEPINEMSGIVKSRRYPDVYWVNNDSGDIARIFAIRKSGEVVIGDLMANAFHGAIPEEGKEPWPGTEVLLANNQDWEDIAIDDEKIYIADLGNNGNYRRDMGVYVLYEPNPEEVIRSRVLNFIPVRYPDQEDYPGERWHFDSEGMFMADGKLYFVTKHRAGGHTEWDPSANLYRLDTFKTSEANVLKKVDRNENINVATGADLSPDGKHLAIVTYSALWIFEAPTYVSKWLSGKSRMLPLEWSVT